MCILRYVIELPMFFIIIPAIISASRWRWGKIVNGQKDEVDHNKSGAWWEKIGDFQKH